MKMWLMDVMSEGDLTNENYHIVHDPDSAYSDFFGNRPRFMDSLDVKLRKDLVINCISRLAAELEFLNDHQDTDLYDIADDFLRYDDLEFPD